MIRNPAAGDGGEEAEDGEDEGGREEADDGVEDEQEILVPGALPCSSRDAVKLYPPRE